MKAVASMENANEILVDPNNIVQTLDNHVLINPESNLNYQAFISNGFVGFLNMNCPGLLEMSEMNPLENSDRDDLARDIIRYLLNTQHNMSMYLDSYF